MSLPSFSSNSLSENFQRYARNNNFHDWKSERSKLSDNENADDFQLSGKGDSLLDSISSNHFLDDDHEEINFSDFRSGKYGKRNMRETGGDDMEEEVEEDVDNKNNYDNEDDIDMLFNLDSSSVSSIRSQNH
jgi:hypothetical protein